jgi:hypothetical protein
MAEIQYCSYTDSHGLKQRGSRAHPAADVWSKDVWRLPIAQEIPDPVLIARVDGQVVDTKDRLHVQLV